MTSPAGWLIRTFAPPALRALAGSWQIEIVGPEHWKLAGGGAFILLCWHEVLLPVMWVHRRRGIAAVVSEARDGEYLSAFARSVGYGLIRGSSTRGGTRALRETIRTLRGGTPVGITPDGPRGPAREPKPGALIAAALGRAMILPVHVAARPAWRARSWDRFVLPGPFAQLRVAYGEPFAVGPGRSGRQEALVRLRRELEGAERLAAWHDDAVTRTA